MHIARGIGNLPPLPHGGAVTIGTFDGVHVGHRLLIHRLAREARNLGVPVIVALFEPQPREFLQPEQAPARLLPLREKLERLRTLPVDVVLVLRFNRALAELPADGFIDQVLVDGLKTRTLIVGDDFRFGRGRTGDFAHLVAAGTRHGFKVHDTPSLTHHGRRVSSTWVREALDAGDCPLARHLLGEAYSLSGRAVAGHQTGRQLGFPTANLALRNPPPLRGVFAVTVQGVGGRIWPGVANIGVRPTFDRPENIVLEVHLLGFSGDLYQRTLRVSFHAKLREERRFASPDELQERIARDAEEARETLERGGFITHGHA